MTRITAVTDRDAGFLSRLVFRFARRSLAKLAGRSPEQAIEPARLYAHVPKLLRGYGRLEQATSTLHRLDRRLQALAEVKTSALTHCEYCIDISSQIARRWGLADEELLALPRYAMSPLFSDLDKLVLDYATAMTRTPVTVSDNLVERLRGHLDDGQLVELTHHVALENMRNRFNSALGVGAAGFSEGMVCAVPEAPSPET